MTSLVSMKMTFDGETRRLRLGRGTFAELSAAVRGAFPAVRGNFKLEYTDDEGDVCAVSDDATLSEMWAVLAEKGGTLRFNVSTVEPSNQRRHHNRAPQRTNGRQPAIDVPDGAPAVGLTTEERLATLDMEVERLRSEFASCSGSRQLPDRVEQRITKIREKFVERAARMQRARPAGEAARRCDDLQAGTAERLSKLVGRAIAHAASKVVEGEAPPCGRRFHGRRHCGGRRGCTAAHAAALARGEDAKDAAAQSQVVHRGVECDGCGMAPIRGIRYKSATREDFDLCEACESQRWQDKSQLYLKIRHPEQAPKAIFAAVGGTPSGPCAQLEELLKANRTGAGVDLAALFGGEAADNGPRCGHGGMRRRGRGRGCRWNRGGGQFGRLLRKMAEAAAQNGGFEGPSEWRRQHPQKQQEQPAAAAAAPEPAAEQTPNRPATAELEREQLEAAIRASLTVPPATPEDTASASASSAAAAPELQAATNSGGEAPELRAHFVAHTTMADRPTIEPGTRFVKGWRVSNPGPAAWPRGTALIATEPSGLIAPSQVPVLRLPAAGETVDLAVEFQAPSQPGRYQSYWRLVTPAGEQFGHRLWADVFVANSNASQVLSSLAAGEPAASGGAAVLAHDDNDDDEDDAAAVATETAGSTSARRDSHYDDVFVDAADARPLLEPAITAPTPAVPAVEENEDEDEDDGVVVEPLERVSPEPSAPPAAAAPAAAPQDPFERAVAELLSLGIGSEADVRAQLHRFRGSKDRAANALLASLQ